MQEKNNFSSSILYPRGLFFNEFKLEIKYVSVSLNANLLYQKRLKKCP